MSAVTAPSRTHVASRRFGYGVAALINGLLMLLINVTPGWEAVPFLTEATPQVLGLINATLVASLVANVLYIAYSPRWVTAFGGVITTAVGLVAAIRMWQVFPFDFRESAIDWSIIAHGVLAVAVAGSAIAVLVQLGMLLRAIVARQ